LSYVLTEIARAVGGVGEDLCAGRLVFDEPGSGVGVAAVASGQVRGGDDAGVALLPPPPR
jgi:hypothetical protein